ncbi:DUF4297 domain-containing protein [Peribacillus simplex]|uniref:DUF4297 domain-containing protein n=2 Tax=Peribacillus TaxID=2675229 RepID=A0AA90P7F3_9BACI|nr:MULTISPECIES: DUF4297 domain-containing protein [Peribacillus]MDP1422117.1 DUF4297 domain-containing protein [Peribacillus simplex]MDP1454777.1 DUF4297 domain-containing protein [Peribacillus frigoritolerans]
MTIMDKLVSVRPPENSGSRSSNRFTYQKDWALMKALELYEEQSDFLLVLDYHDDILILDSEYTPEKASFYQIKTRTNGSWTLPSLLKQDKGEQKLLNSKLGKLYNNKLNFPENTLSLNFVSNTTYNIKLGNNKNAKDSGLSIISLNHICSKEKEKVLTAIKKEFAKEDCNEIFNITNLIVTPLSLGDHKSHALGIVNNFLIKNDYEKVNTDLFYKALYGEIDIKNDYEYSLQTVTELLEKKSVGGSTITKILKRLVPSTLYDEFWKEVKDELYNSNLYSLSILNKYNYAWKKCHLDKMKSNHILLDKLIFTIIPLVQARMETCKTYVELMEQTYSDYQKISQSFPEEIFDEYYVKSLALMEYLVLSTNDGGSL